MRVNTNTLSMVLDFHSIINFILEYRGKNLYNNPPKVTGEPCDTPAKIPNVLEVFP